MNPDADAPAHVAGLLVVAGPGRLRDVARGILEVPGAEVHARDDATGRLVVTLDTETVGEQQSRYEAIALLAGVLSVDLVCHYFEPASPAPARGPDPRAGAES